VANADCCPYLTPPSPSPLPACNALRQNSHRTLSAYGTAERHQRLSRRPHIRHTRTRSTIYSLYGMVRDGEGGYRRVRAIAYELYPLMTSIAGPPNTDISHLAPPPAAPRLLRTCCCLRGVSATASVRSSRRIS